MEETDAAQPFLLLQMLLQLGTLLSVLVNYFYRAVLRNQDCSTHGALSVTYNTVLF